MKHKKRQVFPKDIHISWVNLRYDIFQLRICYGNIYQLEKEYSFNNKFCVFQCEYLDWIADLCGFPHVEHWRDQEVTRGYQRLGNQPETFRDEWDDDDLMEEAYEDFARLNLINFHPSRFLESGR